MAAVCVIEAALKKPIDACKAVPAGEARLHKKLVRARNMAVLRHVLKVSAASVRLTPSEIFSL